MNAVLYPNISILQGYNVDMRSMHVYQAVRWDHSSSFRITMFVLLRRHFFI